MWTVWIVLGALASCRSSLPTAECETALPRLHCTTLLPLQPLPNSSSGWGRVSIERERPLAPAAEPPFASDAEAEQFLRGWLVQTFGPLPPETGLQLIRVQRSASGGDHPRYDWDHGHTLVFQQTWRNFLTDRTVVLYLQGRSRVSGSVELARFRAIPGSERRILDEAEVRLLLAQTLRDLGEDDALARDLGMHLEFLYADGDEDSCELRPVWMLGGGPGYIDAHTGEVGRNG